MDRRNFLKAASGFALLAAGTATGVSRIFAGTPLSSSGKELPGREMTGNNSKMEYRKLGGLDVSGVFADGGLLWRQVRQKRNDSSDS